ncbi:unnamed protein product [Bemisia tabaci]|uniref:Intraflagellar transport 52 n=2 Tax=Bemisia tabaci TaxID=7038 RepID=A0A9P0A679_BEMTA|nr:unnamed protein product [Bemisia tabaci]
MAPVENTSADINVSNTTNARGNVILFDASKNEHFGIHENYKQFHHLIRGSWTVDVNKDELSSSQLQGVTILVLAGPQEMFSEGEFDAIKKFMESGGSVFVMLSEGGEKSSKTNVNFLLEEFGIMINNDCVVRTHYYKYFLPKECLIVNGVVNRGICQFVNKNVEDASQAIQFLYPFGATLNVAKPAVAILSSGSAAYPQNRPVCAFCKTYSQGKLVALGSGHMFSDKYIDKEENELVRRIIFALLSSPDSIQLHQIDAEDPDILDYEMVPDMCMMSERVQTCLQETAEDTNFIHDYTQLFSDNFYSVHLKHVASILDAYKELNIKHEPLKLIPPQFQIPFPPLQVAVFPPSFRDLNPPCLELYDLEEAFSSERSRLAQLANKCLSSKKIDKTHEEEVTDLEYFIKESAKILDVENVNSGSAQSILHSITLQIAEFKKNP